MQQEKHHLCSFKSTHRQHTSLIELLLSFMHTTRTFWQAAQGLVTTPSCSLLNNLLFVSAAFPQALIFIEMKSAKIQVKL